MRFVIGHDMLMTITMTMMALMPMVTVIVSMSCVNRLTALQTISIDLCMFSIDNHASKDSQCRARDAELLR